MGAVIAPWILSPVAVEALSTMDPNAAPAEIIALYGKILPGLLVYMLYAMFLLGITITGLVLLIINFRKLIWKEGASQLPGGTAVKTVYWNVGMVLYILLCTAAIVLSLV